MLAGISTNYPDSLEYTQKLSLALFPEERNGQQSSLEGLEGWPSG